MMTKKFQEKNLNILEDVASGVQRGDIEPVIVYVKLVYNMKKVTLTWWFSTKFCDDALT